MPNPYNPIGKVSLLCLEMRELRQGNLLIDPRSHWKEVVELFLSRNDPIYLHRAA